MTFDPWPSAHPIFGGGKSGWRLLLEVRPVKGKLTTRQQRRLIVALSGDWDGPESIDIGADGLSPFIWRRPILSEVEIVEGLADVGILLRYRCAWVGSEAYYSSDGPDWRDALDSRKWHEVDKQP